MAAIEWKQALTYDKAGDGTKYINEAFGEFTGSLVKLTGTHPNITAIDPALVQTDQGGTNSDFRFNNPISSNYQGVGGSGSWQNLINKVQHDDESQDHIESAPIQSYGGDNGVGDSSGQMRYMLGVGQSWFLTAAQDMFTDGDGETGLGAHSHGDTYLQSNPGSTTTDLSTQVNIADTTHPDVGQPEIEVIAYDGAANTLLIRLPYTSFFSGSDLTDDFCTSIRVENSTGSDGDTRTLAATNDLVAGINGRLVLLNTNQGGGQDFSQAGATSRVIIVGFKHFLWQTVNGNMVEDDAILRPITYSCHGVQADTATIDEATSTDYVAGTGITTAANLDTNDDDYIVSEITGGGTVTTNTFTLTVKPNNTWSDHARLELVNDGGTANSDFKVRMWSPARPAEKYTWMTTQSSGADDADGEITPSTSQPLGSLAVGQVKVSNVSYGSATDPVAMILLPTTA